MVQTASRVYGYVEDNWQFTPDIKTVAVPKKRRAYIKFVDEEIIDENEIEERMEMVKALKGIIPPDVDLKTIRDERLARKGLL